jgi:hypothetical protein
VTALSAKVRAVAATGGGATVVVGLTPIRASAMPEVGPVLLTHVTLIAGQLVAAGVIRQQHHAVVIRAATQSDVGDH